jgi:hypothetical protein
MRSVDDDQIPTWLNAAALAVWLAAAVGAFLPFAVGTSPFDAVMRRVPNDEGNWWHLLIGAPFFLAFPMIWLRLRAFFSRAPLPVGGRRALWIVSGLLMFGTLLVEAPFLAHRAGTSEAQRLAVIAAGLGIPLVSISRLVTCRRAIAATRASIAGVTTAYLANASLCLIVYGEAKFGTSSRSGWFLTMAIVWPMALELVSVLFGTDSAVGQSEAVS